ncbi:MAG: S49 family peptidase, partial [bacterium]|nr:S49 family peptidase [bacterium]
HTAGRNKAILDPFSPEKAEDVSRLRALQDEIHEGFIDLVKTRRKTLSDDPDLFSGAFWTGGKAVGLGLVDRVGSLRAVLKEKFGDKVKMKTIAPAQGLLRRRLGLGAGAAGLAGQLDGVVGLLEERLLWERYGL